MSKDGIFFNFLIAHNDKMYGSPELPKPWTAT